MTNPKAREILEKIADMEGDVLSGYRVMLNPIKLAEYLAEITPDV